MLSGPKSSGGLGAVVNLTTLDWGAPNNLLRLARVRAAAELSAGYIQDSSIDPSDERLRTSPYQFYSPHAGSRSHLE